MSVFDHYVFSLGLLRNCTTNQFNTPNVGLLHKNWEVNQLIRFRSGTTGKIKSLTNCYCALQLQARNCT